jgi:uncharacterized membrane protein
MELIIHYCELGSIPNTCMTLMSGSINESHFTNYIISFYVAIKNKIIEVLVKHREILILVCEGIY